MRFKLGALVATPGVLEAIPEKEIQKALGLYTEGDWGCTYEEDAKLNDYALTHKERILATYKYEGKKFWIITEWDRSVTTVLLPSEY